jgi:diketogulonate reductase-like aldo/keto reductase
LVLFVSSREQNQIFGFALSDQDMAKLDALEKRLTTARTAITRRYR